MPPRSPSACRCSSSLPRSHSVIRPTTGSGVGPNSVELACGEARERPAGLDHRHLHAEADAEIGHLALARETGGEDLALGAARAEPAGHQDAVNALEVRRRVGRLENLALDPVELDPHLVGHAAVGQRLDQRFVGVLEAGVLADDRDRHLALGIVIGARHRSQRRMLGLGAGSMPKAASTSRSRPGGVIERRHVVDRTRVARLDHRAFAHVAEEAELAPLLARDLAVRSGRAGCAAGCRSSAAP